MKGTGEEKAVFLVVIYPGPRFQSSKAVLLSNAIKISVVILRCYSVSNFPLKKSKEYPWAACARPAVGQGFPDLPLLSGLHKIHPRVAALIFNHVLPLRNESLGPFAAALGVTYPELTLVIQIELLTRLYLFQKELLGALSVQQTGDIYLCLDTTPPTHPQPRPRL